MFLDHSVYVLRFHVPFYCLNRGSLVLRSSSKFLVQTLEQKFLLISEYTIQAEIIPKYVLGTCSFTKSVYHVHK